MISNRRKKFPTDRKSVVQLLDLPVSSNRMFVLWLSQEQQQPNAGVSLTRELEYFHAYVEVWNIVFMFLLLVS